jgi:murein DD-endopeptidase MepM/ murein hydrolase activator NlpD
MDEHKETYTVMIFRGSMAGPLRFRFSRALVRKAMIVGIALLLVELVLLSQVVMRFGEMWELQALRAEMAGVREQTTAFSNAVNDLRKRLLAMKEVNQRLRLMLGIEPAKEEITNGQGGEDLPLPEPYGKELDEAGAPQTSGQPPSLESRSSESDLTSRIQDSLSWLQSEADLEERTLQGLTQAAESRQAKWNATPSIWPVKGWVTSGFGQRVSPFTGQVVMHDGLDIGAAANTPVQAPAAGRVVVTGFDPRMGNLVSLDHGFGIETQYGHLGKILVKNGQKIKRGDVIGLVGSTGLSTGPHLHYHVKYNSRSVDPQRYILN